MSVHRCFRVGAGPGGLGVFALAWVSACASTAPGQPGAFPPADPELQAANEALGDPHRGRFGFEEAMRGLPEQGRVLAILETDEGEIPCVLDPGHAPLTVANFVGLARGLRPFAHEDGTWRAEPFYDGIPWHRAFEGQFVQTGRRGRLADGGYFIQDEISLGDSFDRPGVLAMGNTGDADTGSTQFFITTGPAPQLEGHHTMFGQCDGEAVLRRIERRVLAGEAPVLQTIRIEREPG